LPKNVPKVTKKGGFSKQFRTAYGRVIWIEKVGYDGRPAVYYRYDSKGRLKKHTRKIFGYMVTPAEYSRFGEAIELRIATHDPRYVTGSDRISNRKAPCTADLSPFTVPPTFSAQATYY
jgi:hypothetical protein